MNARRRCVTVFGGTGFLGRHIVRHLVGRGFRVRVATRHATGKTPTASPDIEPVRADIGDAASVAAALSGADGAVNAVSLYVEAEGRTFQAVHVDAAARMAGLAREAGLGGLVHVSGIGADRRSPSRYVASRGRGDDAVASAFPSAAILRPSVLFGPGDSFLSAIADLLRRSPVFPLFGRGLTRLQPAHVDDVARAAAALLAAPRAAGVYELGGPDVLAYRALIEKVAAQIGRRPILVPVPFGVWHAAAAVAERLPGAPLARNQVELMRNDNTASGRYPGFDALGITPRSIGQTLAQLFPGPGTGGGRGA
ncbi:MAG: complex I NDUFA9 subunit family protein [Alphaproteobacteria bacterium]|nr:complex I NDUFA9 subunit family protein [Alphaproteobacteria bacterium]